MHMSKHRKKGKTKKLKIDFPSSFPDMRGFPCHMCPETYPPDVPLLHICVEGAGRGLLDGSHFSLYMGIEVSVSAYVSHVLGHMTQSRTGVLAPTVKVSTMGLDFFTYLFTFEWGPITIWMQCPGTLYPNTSGITTQ